MTARAKAGAPAGDFWMEFLFKLWYCDCMDKKEIEQKIQEIVQKIVKEFKPEKIILFGSWAWGNPSPDSDVDLFVVKETRDTRRTAREIDGALWGRTIPLDIVVYTPDSVKKGLDGGDFFINDITKKGKLLYATK